MPGYEMSKDELLKSLRRIEGQVRGVAQMVEDDRFCIDVLTQISAATKSLQRVAVGMFDDHLRHCVADAVAAGGSEADHKLTEATAAVERLLRT
ncbi:MAG: CsoR family transcriptional regulator, copper-sensing transcriptional repressor [Actinomycetota bacterium]